MVLRRPVFASKIPLFVNDITGDNFAPSRSLRAYFVDSSQRRDGVVSLEFGFFEPTCDVGR
jgi:hypothetical protein